VLRDDSFTYSTTRPAVSTTYPVNGGTYDASASSWTGAAAGTMHHLSISARVGRPLTGLLKW